MGPRPNSDICDLRRKRINEEEEDDRWSPYYNMVKNGPNSFHVIEKEESLFEVRFDCPLFIVNLSHLSKGWIRTCSSGPRSYSSLKWRSMI